VTEVEEGEVYHYCDDYKGSRDGRSIEITGITETRSSYSTDSVEFEFLDSGESGSMGLKAFGKDLERGRFNPGLTQDCSECNEGDTE